MVRARLAGLLLVGVLAACGGGGGGNERKPDPVAPALTAAPRSQTVVVGHAVTFEADATGDAPLAYQWSRDGDDVAGATSRSYTLASPALADSGAQFRVKVTNAAGSVESDPAKLTVNPDLEDEGVNFVATWATSVQQPQPSQMPAFTLASSTLRQVIHLSVGGSRFRLNLSNRYGDGPVQILAAHLARAEGDWTAGDASSARIVAGTDHALTFGGVGSVTIAAGEEVTSDSIEFAEAVPPLQNLTVSLALGSVPARPTGHPGSRTLSYVVAGDHAADVTLSSPRVTPRWFFISSLEVEAPETTRAIAVLGDSLTDGKGSTPDLQDRWTDLLAQALAERHAADPESRPEVAVLNLGTGGNGFTSDWLPYMESGVHRFDHDILQQKGVKWAIVFMGVNDIAYNGATAATLQDGYAAVVDAAHDAGVLLYGATITPFAGWATADTAEKQGIRTAFNEWLRHGEGADLVDGVLDFSAAIVTPDSNPESFLGEYVSYPDNGNDGGTYTASDHLHFNAAGYAAIVESIDLDLFR